MKRTISVMVGKGSVSHNSRKFNAKNTDPERTPLNISYCNQNIKSVYHHLFDEALQRYNDHQKRADRKIDDYYEKIRNGKQEKLFHEIILQIGNCDDTGATSEMGETARQILDEYYQGFAERNPNLYVFSAHLHMDEATPHLHIDFVPFTTGGNRGLDTRVSLKQALAAQGFKGGSRQETEWNQWVQSEKEQLASVMERHGIEWEHKGTHEKHLSVLDYEKKVRSAEIEKMSEKVADLSEKVADMESKYQSVCNRIQNYENGEVSLSELKTDLDTSSDYAIPDPQGLMSAKSYKAKFVNPLIKKLKELVVTVFARYLKAIDDYHRVQNVNNRYYRENQRLQQDNEYLRAEIKDFREDNQLLRAENKDYAFLRKVLGWERIDNLMKEARELQERKRKRNQTRER